MEWSPLPLRMGLSLRSHSKGHGRIPHSIQEEMVYLHFHSKESSELASFLLSEVEIPPFLVEWEWSGRHFPLEWDWHSIPTLRGTGESPTSFRREWSTSIFHSRDSLLLSEVEISISRRRKGASSLLSLARECHFHSKGKWRTLHSHSKGNGHSNSTGKWRTLHSHSKGNGGFSTSLRRKGGSEFTTFLRMKNGGRPFPPEWSGGFARAPSALAP